MTIKVIEHINDDFMGNFFLFVMMKKEQQNV
jgi:hypothetical protein